ncbi:MAG: gamma-glutamyltransferase [Bordetella sp.]|uniref:gamma-glutamyltransferase n=1 Tax=Bordetella sp. TaxID=28081 RepID=UPI003F7C51F2
MVVSAQRLASQAGQAILKRGGNAVDAAVAMGYALAVVDPCCGNLGGGGFMTLHLADGRNVFLNFRETAPARAAPDMYLDARGEIEPRASLDGWRAVAVPGTVLGLDTALREFGSLPRREVMAPAIALADKGFVLTREDTAILNLGTARFLRDPQARRIFLHPDGSPLRPGERLVQHDLAATLKAIAGRGSSAFYRGAAAAAIGQASRQSGGVLRASDLARYRVTQSPPLSCQYRGYTVLSAPPPSSGGVTLCELLGVLSGYDLHGMGFGSAQYVHTMVEAMRHAYEDRNTELGDPAFVQNPIDRLLSPAHAQAIRAQIKPDVAGVSHVPKTGLDVAEKPQTTHYSVVDAKGNAVAVTYTLNGRFGAGVMAPGHGFFLNDEMDDFTSKPGAPNLFGLVQGKANAIEPGKRPLSSMAPTLILHDGKVKLVLGSPGGSRIITIVLQVAINLIDFGMQPQEAVDAPRIHHQWLPDVVDYERGGLSPDTLRLLEAMGYDMKAEAPWGAAEIIQVGALPGQRERATQVGNDSVADTGVQAGWRYGANDPRRPAGAAIGY